MVLDKKWVNAYYYFLLVALRACSHFSHVFSQLNCSLLNGSLLTVSRSCPYKKVPKWILFINSHLTHNQESSWSVAEKLYNGFVLIFNQSKTSVNLNDNTEVKKITSARASTSVSPFLFPPLCDTIDPIFQSLIQTVHQNKCYC